MYWNHRILQRELQGEISYWVVEAFYDEEDNRILGWTEEEPVWGESVEGIRTSLEWMGSALEKPVLIESELLREIEERVPEPEEEYETFTMEDLMSKDSPERLTMDEVLDSLGLDREDVDPCS